MKPAWCRPRVISASIVIATGLFFALASGCERPGPQLPPQPCQPGTCPPGQWPTLAPPAPDPSPTAAPPGLMPAFVGFPCTATEDMVCGWGRCIAGRCGGCQTTQDCKPSGVCGWTPIGMACIYGGSPLPR